MPKKENQDEPQPKMKHDPRLVRRDDDDKDESLEKITESIVIAFFLALIIKLIMYLYGWMQENSSVD